MKKRHSSIFASFTDLPQSYAASTMAFNAVGLLTGMYTGSGYEAYYYDAEGREIQRYATGYNCGRRTTAYNYDGTISKRTYSYKESSLPDMEEEYVYDSCGRLTSTTIRVDKAKTVSVPELTAEQNAEGIEAADTANPAASVRWATAVVRREYDAVGRLARLRHGDAAVTEYGYDVHSWPVSQYTTYGTAANASSAGYTLEYAPCYNGNIARRTWDEGGYTYTYDALNRLTSAVFTPAEELADRPAVERDRIPDFSVYYDYDLRGNATNVVRYGVIDAVSDFDRIETFGTLDELSCAYDGNQLSNISAITEALPFDGVTGLHADGEFELSYNEAGDMVSDASRGLLYTRWNADGHPMQYDLEGGHRHYLYWDGLGNHLYTSYETAVTSPAAGQIAGRTRRTSVRAYSGDGHVLRGGAGNSTADTLEMLRFAGGYFDENLVSHYYVTDYLGSNIAVIRSDGTLVQSATYYPYGEPHRDPSASAGIGISVAALPLSATTSASSGSAAASTFSNSYLYGGKEYVRRDGLREYIYGARMCIPSETRFSSMDKHAENYPSFSPYAFCMCNPVNFMDPSGMIVVADSIAQIAILDGFDDYAQKYIEFDDEGRLNIDKISEYDGDSENMASLRRLATSTIEYIIEYTDKAFVGNEVKTLSEELGNIADTTFPDNPYKNGYNTTNSRSIDDNVRIYCGSFLVGEYRATNIAHELYGHADFYEQGLDPMHHYKNSQGEDYRIIMLTDANITLDNRIKRAKDEARRNYKKTHP